MNRRKILLGILAGEESDRLCWVEDWLTCHIAFTAYIVPRIVPFNNITVILMKYIPNTWIFFNYFNKLHIFVRTFCTFYIIYFK